MIVSNKELAHLLDELENKADLIEVKHDTFAHNTRLQLKQVFDAIRELMVAPEPESESESESESEKKRSPSKDNKESHVPARAM
jgi:small-conductance mechanosensitive channel